MLPRAPRPVRRRVPGALSTSDFMRGLLEQLRALVPDELGYLEMRHQHALIKVFADDPAVHFELWLHHGSARVELGLHFETRDAARNQRLLEYVADELPFLKHAISPAIEAEPWDRGWTRLYLTRPITRLDPAEQSELAQSFATFISVLEPIRQEAVAELAS
jgi:hypothetical protein